MGWWPFGRKRRKDKKSDRPQTIQSQRTVEQEKGLSKPDPVAREPLLAPSDPFDDPPEQPEKAFFPPQTPDQRFPTPQNKFHRPSIDDITALPQSPRSRPDRDTALQPVSSSYINSQRSPTLAGRNSGKRRQGDQDREEHNRLMTAPVPIPKRTGASSPHLSRRDVTRGRSDHNRQLQDPSSTISLPTPPSARSSITAMSDRGHFGIGVVDVLSPRPTLRHSLHGQYASATALRSGNPSRTGSRKEARPWSPGTFSEKDTIDEYADRMDARTLRELMDRDGRRRERKRKAEGYRAQRRLDRYAGGGDADTEERKSRSRRTETEGKGRDLRSGPEPGPSGLAKDYPMQKESAPQAMPAGKAAQDPFRDPEVGLVEAPAVLRDLHPEPLATVPYAPSGSPTRHERQASAFSYTSDPRSGSMQDLSDTASFDRRASQPSSRRTGALAALFKRSGIGRRSSGAEADDLTSQGTFSNASRESMNRKYTPPPDIPERTYRRRSSGAPIRTKSKFREDLPELSGGEPESPGAAELEAVPPLSSERALSAEEPAMYPRQSHRDSYDSIGLPSAALLSQSLASVDSEASWLSGRPKTRASQQLSTTRSSLVQRPSVLGASTEDLNDSEGSPARTRTGHSYSLSGLRAQLAPEDEESEDGTAGRVEPGAEERVNQGFVSRQPTFVDAQRTKSSEGLLRQFSSNQLPQSEGDEYETGSDTSEHQQSPGETTEVSEVRQTYSAQHGRNMSAGSARLLEIPARRDSLRNSQLSGSPSEGARTPTTTTNL